MVGIGNALVDVIAHHDDRFIEKHTLVKGSMTLIEADRALSLHASMVAPIEMSGGSAANTMCGVASFGGTAAYIGKVAPDGLGHAFRHDLHAEGVAFPNAPARAEVPTGRCLIVVTPDAQRTIPDRIAARSGGRRRRPATTSSASETRWWTSSPTTTTGSSRSTPW